MSKTRVALALSVVAMTGCSSIKSSHMASDSLPPPVVVGAAEITQNTTTLCSEKELAELIANADPSIREALSARTFFFSTDSSELFKEASKPLSAHASLLSNDSPYRIQLTGHTDERGTATYNLALGERRANAVASYLMALGAPASHIEVVSFGKEKPAVEESNEEAWAKNRRVELDYAGCSGI